MTSLKPPGNHRPVVATQRGPPSLERPMDLAEAKQHLSVVLGGRPLVADSTGAVGLAFGQVIVNLRPAAEPGAFLLEARLGPARLDDDELLEALMDSNRWPSPHGAGVVARDFNGIAFLVHRFEGEHLQAFRLVDTLERFARRAVLWQQTIAEAVPAGPPLKGAIGDEAILA